MPRFKAAKTKKAARKRFKITATGKILRKSAGKRHLLGHKSAKHKRRLGKTLTVDPTMAHHIKSVLPFG